MQGTLTKGNPLKKILLFTLPLLLGNLFQQAYNMADAAIVGQTLGPNALGAVGATGSVQFLVLGFCIGITSGFAIPVANTFGAQRIDMLKRNVYTGSFLILTFAIFLTLISSLSVDLILAFLQVSDEIYVDTYNYIFVIFLGIPFTLLYNYSSALLRSIGDSTTPFLLLAFSSILNIVLDFFCILTLGLGVKGAAIATITSQALSGILCLFVIYKKFPLLHFSKEHMVLKKNNILTMLNIGVPMGLQFSITAIGSMVMQSANNALGGFYVPAYAAGCKINSFMMSPFDALANATCTFCSQNYGALEEERVTDGIKIGVALGILWGVIGGFILVFGGEFLSSLFMSGEGSYEAIKASGEYLACLGYFYVLLGILEVTRLVTQGLGMSKRAILAGAFEMVARITMVYFFVPTYAYKAICYTDQAAWLAADLYIVPMCYIAYKHVVKDIRQTLLINNQ